MFYFDSVSGYKVLKSDLLDNAFFTLRNPSPQDWENNIFHNFKAKRIITPEQTHSDNVQIIDKRNVYPETDGLITNESETLIFLRFADCTPLVFYDPVKKVSAISHAGWRGTASKIGVKTVEKMSAFFDSNVRDIVVLIGPAISGCCYEVGDDVKEKLLSTVNETSGLFSDNYADLKAINERQLREIGIKKTDICPYCTSCNNDMFYSYRKEQGTTNRHFAVITG